MSGSLNFLFLNSKLDDLLLLELFKLLLLCNEEVFFVSSGLVWNCVQAWSNILVVDNGNGEVGWRLDNLILKKYKLLVQ
jgi:hypothetical protein